MQQSADHGTQTRGAAEGDLHRIAQYAQYSYHIVERLLAPCCLLLFLCAVVVVQRAQLVQVVLILSVVLRICIVVGFALLPQLGVVIRQPVVVQLLRILLTAVQLVQLAHQLVAAAGIGVQRQTVQRRDGTAQRADLLLVCLLRHTCGIAGAVASGQCCRLCRSIRTGVVGVLQIVLLVLTVERVFGVAVLEAPALQQLAQKLIDLILIAALVVVGAVRLPFLQGILCTRHRLAGLIAGICQCIFHLRAAAQSRSRITALRRRQTIFLRLCLHRSKRFVLFLFVCHKNSFSYRSCSLVRSSSDMFSVSRLLSTYCSCSCSWYR